MGSQLIHNLRARRNVVLSFLIILIGMLMTAQYSFEKGFSRGALEWRDAKSRFFVLNHKHQQCKVALSEGDEKIARLEVDNQQLSRINSALKQELTVLATSSANISQENALYKKILAPEYQQKGIQINSVQIYPSQQTGRFRYEVLLAKFSNQKKITPGTMHLSVQGVQDDEIIQIPLEALSRDWQQGQPYTVRYFQMLKGQIQLPEGFVPESIIVSLVEKGDKSKVSSEDFPWLVSIG